jgi:hypothetical protein
LSQNKNGSDRAKNSILEKDLKILNLRKELKEKNGESMKI